METDSKETKQALLVDKYRQDYLGNGGVGIKALFPKALRCKLTRHFYSFLKIEEQQPYLRYQLPRGFSVDILNEQCGIGRDLAAWNEFLRDDQSFRAEFQQSKGSLAGLTSFFNEEEEATSSAERKFDESIKRMLLGDQTVDYDKSLFELEKKLFSKDHENLVYPIFRSGMWIGFVYLVVENDSGIKELIASNKDFFSVILGEKAAFNGQPEELQKRRSAEQFLSQMLSAALFVGAKFEPNSKQKSWKFVSKKTKAISKQESTKNTFLIGSIALDFEGFDEISHFTRIHQEWKLNQTIHEATSSRARAAIFARNFSHVIGSHVISNPHFAERLSPELYYPQKNLQEQLKKWNENSKKVTNGDWFGDPFKPLLDVARVLKRAIEELGGDPDLWPMKRFHQYLQGRFDFIARAVTATTDPTEPVFFINDLLDGFVEQTALLDTFVADLLVRKEDIHFRIVLPSKSKDETPPTFVSVWRDEEPNRKQDGSPYLTHTWELPKNLADDVGQGKSKNAVLRAEDHDFLVGLPCGSIAGHAFYSLLENLIRNSIKYQNKMDAQNQNGNEANEPKYQITIKVEKVCPSDTRSESVPTEPAQSGDSTQEEASRNGNHNEQQMGEFEAANGSHSLNLKPVEHGFRISVFDNWSVNGKDHKHRCNLLNSIATPLVDDQGKACDTNLGIQEMKLCAANLRSNSVEPENAITLATSEPQTRTESTEDKPLTFQFNLEQPLLLGIVRASTDGKFTQYETVATGSLANFLTRNCHVLVVDGASCGQPASQENGTSALRQMLEDADKHRQLPYRVLVLHKENGNGGTFPQTPLRRVVEATNSVLYEALFEASADNLNDEGTRNKLVLDSYREWLKHWKKQVCDQNDGGKRPWLLCIGLDREPAQVKAVWNAEKPGRGTAIETRRLVNFNSDGLHKDFAQVIVNAGEEAIDSSLRGTLDSANPRQVLLFDNHGRCFGDWDAEASNSSRFDDTQTVRFYQKFGGETPELFRRLSTPPQDKFGFTFFIYSLLESCLANIAIVDERLASDLLSSSGDKEEFIRRLAAHQKAGVFPIFTFKEFGCKDPTHGHYKPDFANQFATLTDRVCADEGIRYCNKGEEYCDTHMILTPKSKSELELTNELAIDAIVIHEGALDLLTQNGINWNQDFVNQLYQIAPVVIRSSGRGRTTVQFPETVPFIEFNIISNAILTSRYKYGLVRGLLGSTGQSESS